MTELPPAEQLRALIHEHNVAGLRELLGRYSPEEISYLVSRLDDDEQARLWAILPPEDAASLMQELPLALAAEMLNDVAPATAAAILDRLPSDEQTDLLTHVRREQAQAVLARMEPDEAADVNRLWSFPEDTAGGLMVTEYLAYPASAKVVEVLNDLRTHSERYAQYPVQYTYVVTEQGELTGVARLRDLLFHADHRPLQSVAVPDPAAVRVEAGVDELRGFFERCHFLAVPVVDAQNRLLGVVTRADVEEAAADRAEQAFLRFSGIIRGEEFRAMPFHVRVGGRIVWLGTTLLLSFVAASVVGLFQDTLADVIALAVFLPVISGMSGNAGNQAIAVTMRELAVGLVKPHELGWVLLKEASVGVVNGLALGGILSLAAYLWKGDGALGLVVGCAQALSVLMAACLGGVIPLLLKRLRLDPALAAPPILTTLTDASGFFMTLGLARLWLT